MDINFYHVVKTDKFKALSSVLDKIMQQGNRALIYSKDNDFLAKLDEIIWSNNKTFLPHDTDMCQNPERQPILLSSKLSNLNNADYLIIADGESVPEKPIGFEKIFNFFCGNTENELKLARTRWKEYEKSYNLIYWQQNKDGSWQKKL